MQRQPNQATPLRWLPAALGMVVGIWPGIQGSVEFSALLQGLPSPSCSSLQGLCSFPPPSLCISCFFCLEHSLSSVLPRSLLPAWLSSAQSLGFRPGVTHGEASLDSQAGLGSLFCCGVCLFMPGNPLLDCSGTSVGAEFGLEFSFTGSSVGWDGPQPHPCPI